MKLNIVHYKNVFLFSASAHKLLEKLYASNLTCDESTKCIVIVPIATAECKLCMDYTPPPE